MGLIAAAVARPQTVVAGTDAYSTICDKAAALLHSTVDNHALVDGTKRLGWLATAVFLELHDANVVAAPNDRVFELVTQVAASNVDLEEIAHRLEQLSSQLKSRGVHGARSLVVCADIVDDEHRRRAPVRARRDDGGVDTAGR